MGAEKKTIKSTKTETVNGNSNEKLETAILKAKSERMRERMRERYHERSLEPHSKKARTIIFQPL
jgi:transcriptional/translational regulatory protein YebC/TACO1